MTHKRLSRRDFLRASTLAAAGVALAGCATPTPQVVRETVEVPVEETVEVEVEVEVTTAPPVMEPLELRIAWWGSENRTTRTIQVIKMFEEMYPHITMLYEFAGWDDHWTRLATQAAGGNLPDIMQHDYERITEWVGNNLLMPLDAYADSGALDFSDVADSTLEGGRINGELYGITLGTNSLDMEVALDLLEEAGLELPAPNWSWDDFEALCLAIKDSLGIWGYAGNSLFHDHMWKQIHMSKGMWVFSDDGKSLGYEDDQPSIDQLNMILRLYDAEAAMTLEEATARTGEAPEMGPFVTRESVMGFAWSNNIVPAWATAGADRNIGLTTIPRSGDLPAVYIKPSMYFSITSQAKYPDEAAMFIDFFTNSIAANYVLFAERGVPIAAHVRESLVPRLQPAQAVMFDYLALVESDSSPTPRPDPATWADVRNNVFYPEFHDPVLYGLITPEEGAATFRQMANEILAAG